MVKWIRKIAIRALREHDTEYDDLQAKKTEAELKALTAEEEIRRLEKMNAGLWKALDGDVSEYISEALGVLEENKRLTESLIEEKRRYMNLTQSRWLSKAQGSQALYLEKMQSPQYRDATQAPRNMGMSPLSGILGYLEGYIRCQQEDTP